MNLESFPWLSSIVLLPLIGALLMPFLSSKEGEDNTLPRNISLSFLFIDFLLIIGVLFQKFNTSDSSLQLVERASWLPSIGLEWSLGVDGLSAPLVALCKKENGKNVSQAMVKAWEKSGVASRAPFLNVQTTGSQFSTISGK